jgi:hypothetical protein
MGGLGSHHLHPYAVQSAAFYFSLLFPSGALLLLAGAIKERFRHRAGRPSSIHGRATAKATARLIA